MPEVSAVLPSLSPPIVYSEDDAIDGFGDNLESCLLGAAHLFLVDLHLDF